MIEVPVAPPFSGEDERHFGLYLAVLTAKSNGRTDAEIAAALFGIDAENEPDLAQSTVTDWHRRALMLTEPVNLQRIASPELTPAEGTPLTD